MLQRRRLKQISYKIISGTWNIRTFHEVGSHRKRNIEGIVL